jgi:peptidylprolyl isomerase
MRHVVLILLMAAGTATVSAQTATKPASHAATTTKPTTTASRTAAAATGVKLPAGVPAVKGPAKVAFSLRYQEIAIGSGADAEPGKMYRVHYTGWLGANGRADDGRKFDSSYDHPGPPVMDKDGKMERDADGKVKQSKPQPITFVQGMGRAIPGFEQGFTGMKVGGKRRIFIPWQLAYGAKGREGPDAAHPGIPAKSDLIFDVELFDVSEMTTPADHPPMSGMHGMPGGAAHPAAEEKPTETAKPATQAQPK